MGLVTLFLNVTLQQIYISIYLKKETNHLKLFLRVNVKPNRYNTYLLNRQLPCILSTKTVGQALQHNHMLVLSSLSSIFLSIFDLLYNKQTD